MRRASLAIVLSLTTMAIAASTSSAATFTGSFPAGQSISRTSYPYQSFIAGHITAVSDPSSTVGVAKYAIGDRDEPYSETYAGRGDLLTPDMYPSGSTTYTSIPIKIPAGLPAFHGTGSSFFQFAESKDTAASAPGWGLGLLADSSGVDHWLFAGPHGDNFWTGPVVDGGWHTFIVKALNSTSSNGYVALYMDGKLQTLNIGSSAGKTQTPDYATITDGASSWPLDIDSYRSSGTDLGTLTLYHGAPQIGSTLASVGGGGSTPPVSGLTAAFTAPTTSTTGRTVAFDASSSTGSPTSYAWTDGSSKLGSGENLSFTFEYVGVKHVTLTETNAGGATSTVEHDLTVSAAPVVPLKPAFTGPSTSKIGATVAFDSSTSTGSPTKWTWTDANGDVSLGTGKTFSFTFHYAGTKQVTLTETDAAGATSTVEHNLVVS